MSTEYQQAALNAYTAGKNSVSVTRTIVLPLQTSRSKTETATEAIGEFQDMMSYAADIAPSFGEYGWSPMNNAFYRCLGAEFEDRSVKSTVMREAGQKVASSFESWKANGKPGNAPKFGGGDYLRLSNQDINIAENDRGYGVKLSFIPYNPVWFHINSSGYHREFLARIADSDDDCRAGCAELHHDNGDLRLHLSVSWDVDVYEPDDVTTTVGVDLGENVLYSAAVVDSGEVTAVDMESGREYRHTRQQIKRSRRGASERGDLRGVKNARHSYQNYTDHITNVASRRVVDLAVEHKPAAIQLEDLTHYRQRARGAIHDWPFAEIQEKIAYKATEEGIPVTAVDPRGTSTTCRKCGADNPSAREGHDFRCFDCGYQVHADVNAAVNIAQR